MKVELTLSKDTFDAFGQLENTIPELAICVELTEEQIRGIREMFENENVVITGITLVPSETECYIQKL